MMVSSKQSNWVLEYIFICVCAFPSIGRLLAGKSK
jgi:hypothetical protein